MSGRCWIVWGRFKGTRPVIAHSMGMYYITSAYGIGWASGFIGLTFTEDMQIQEERP